MERREMATLLRVSAGDHPPLSPSYRMSRQMWPLLYMCGCTGEGGMKYTCAQLNSDTYLLIINLLSAGEDQAKLSGRVARVY